MYANGQINRKFYENQMTLWEAKKFVYELIESSDPYILENFWIPELKNIILDNRDRKIVTHVTQILPDGENLLIIDELELNNVLKRNWRHFFNINIIDKFFKKLSEIEQN